MKGKKKTVKKAKAVKRAASVEKAPADAALRKAACGAPSLGGDAHVDWKTAIAGLPAEKRAEARRGFRIPRGNCWNTRESRSRTFWISASTRNTSHWQWPAEYWPTNPAPPSAEAWDKSVKEFRGGYARDGEIG